MKLTLTKRAGKTKGEIKKIRREGNIPAALYGHGHSVELITVPGVEFQAHMRKLKQGQLSTSVFELHLNGKTLKAIVKDIQYNHVSYNIEHIDFMLLTKDRPLTVNVPIQITGAAECPGVKLGGTLRQVIRTLRVSCLPEHIPQEFQLDVKELNIAQSKRLSDISLPEKVLPKAMMSEVAVVIAKGKTTA